MTILIISIALVMLAMGLGITPNNARYLLSGYNTMSDAERAQVDIVPYIAYFRRFHQGMALAIGAGGLALLQWAGDASALTFVALFPLAAYFYFLSASRRYFPAGNRSMRLGQAIMAITFVGVAALLAYGFQLNTAELRPNELHISGMYGETLPFSDIASAEMAESLPPISYKIDGFAAGSLRKGHFKTENGEKVKLLLNGSGKPSILIVRKSGGKLYYMPEGIPADALLQGLHAGMGQ